MKNIRYIIAGMLVMASMTACDWFTLDNQPGYDAQVYGTLVDSETEEPVLSEIYATGTTSINVKTGYLTVVELGWKAEANQNWNVRNNGTYRNNLVFAGNYRMDTKDANYYPVTQEFTLSKGENKVDFTVTPYARILNHSIQYNEETKKIEATCIVQVVDPIQTNTLDEVRLCCYTDNFVGSGFNNCKNDTEAVAKNVKIDANGMASVTLAIDTQNEANQTEFQYERTHYVRLAALATGKSVNASKRYNFSPTYSLKLDGSDAVEYTNW